MRYYQVMIDGDSVEVEAENYDEAALEALLFLDLAYATTIRIEDVKSMEVQRLTDIVTTDLQAELDAPEQP